MKSRQGRLGEGPLEWWVSLRRTGYLLSKTGVGSQSKALAVTVAVGWRGHRSLKRMEALRSKRRWKRPDGAARGLVGLATLSLAPENDG